MIRLDAFDEVVDGAFRAKVDVDELDRRRFCEKVKAMLGPIGITGAEDLDFRFSRGGVKTVDKMTADAVRLLTDAKFRKETGKRARASAICRYSTDKIIPQYIQFYEQILGRQ